MHKIRHLKHPNRLTTEGGFRLVRHFSPTHNRRRLAAYCAAVWRTPDMQRFARQLCLRRRFSSRLNKGTGHV